MIDRSEHFPIGASVTIDQLEQLPYAVLAALRASEPVSWVPVLGAWVVTRRDLCVVAMRDADTFTVDDPRFTTGAVVGPSMLSLDGIEHERHRSAFAPHFRPGVVRSRFDAELQGVAASLVDSMAPDGVGDLRGGLAGPLAVETIVRFLGLLDVDPAEVLRWYSIISDAVVAMATDPVVAPAAAAAVEHLQRRVMATLEGADPSMLRSVLEASELLPEELPPDVAVLMFGAIETSEGMTANVLWHLLTHAETLERVRGDRSLVGPAIEESLRLEPAAAVIDRYATTDVDLGGVPISAGDMVSISLLGANRDPEIFAAPDMFDIDRANVGQHLTFVQGPHACLGLHLARLETATAVNAVLDRLGDLRLDAESSKGPTGLIFRKAAVVAARWTPPST